MKRTALDRALEMLDVKIATLLETRDALRELQGKAPVRRPTAVKAIKTAAPNAHD